MKRFLVGGAVRSKLLGVNAADHDWVVIDMDMQDMLACGFIQVGKDFPVFLHPETKEEYALTRAERIDGKTVFGKSVSLEEDLSRRDFTINAMALDDDGNLIDPFGGAQDIKRGVIKMVSDKTFTDDPIRVFRAARFSATLGFSFDDDTKKEMKRVISSMMKDDLSSERIFAELEKGMRVEDPVPMWESLESCGALKAIGMAGTPDFSPMKGSALSPMEKFGLLSFCNIENVSSFMERAGFPNEPALSAKTLGRMREMLPVTENVKEWLDFMQVGGARQNRDRFIRFHGELIRLGISRFSQENMLSLSLTLREKPDRTISGKEDFDSFLADKMKPVLENVFSKRRHPSCT